MRHVVIVLFCSIVSFACNVSPARSYDPLVIAARDGRTSDIRELVGRGADPNARDEGVNAWTPLLHAVHKHQTASVVALLDAGADPNGTDPNGTTPLMMAAGYGYTDVVKVLLARGANPRLTTPDGFGALELARSGVPDSDRFTVFRCQNDTVQALLAADRTLPDRTAQLPLPARVAMRMKGCRS